MTVKLSISVPDDVAAYLQGRGNVSAAVTEAIRRVLPEARRARQREAAQAYGEHVHRRTAQQIKDDRILVESSNDISLRDSHW
jgi:post-segregation antitoxin (ccd killing protein)